MSAEQALQLARSRRTEARALTRRGELTTARKLLQDLVKILATWLFRKEAGPEDPEDADRRDMSEDSRATRSAIARALVDCYGMLGGVEWRAGNLADALAAYQQGRLIGEDPRYGVEDSYNLTNELVLLVVLRPDRLDRIRARIAQAMATVKSQVQGPRRDQWWAWADYGLLSLLLGDRETASHAYRAFHACGPATSDYESVKRVLEQVVGAVGSTDSATAEQVKQAVARIDQHSPHRQ